MTEQTYQTAAQSLGCETACIHAVADVESNGDGFLKNGMPKILFEAHSFHNLTGGKYDIKYPNISSPIWDKKLYYGGTLEYTRLNIAKTLNEDAALKSTSFGKFQIMGSNYKECGYTTVQSFVSDMYVSEISQLMAFVRFLKSTGLDIHLVNKNWQLFALGYNGKGYKANNYDTKLATAYNKYKGA